MSQPEFDQYAANYDRVLAESMPDGMSESGYFAAYKIALMAKALHVQPPRRILDFGCGAGRSLPYLAQYFPDAALAGFDLSPASLQFAAQRVPQARLSSDWATFAGEQFDVILAANVFHHIPPAERVAALQRCREVLRPDGQLFLFEHNPYNPVTRRVFERCPFDVDAAMFSLATAQTLAQQAGFSREQHGYTLFFPRPLAWLRGLEPALKFLPLGAQYYVQMAK